MALLRYRTDSQIGFLITLQWYVHINCDESFELQALVKAIETDLICQITYLLRLQMISSQYDFSKETILQAALISVSWETFYANYQDVSGQEFALFPVTREFAKLSSS